MAGFKEQGFQDRMASAAKAKESALARLKAKPPMDDAEKTRRVEAARVKEAAAVEKREAKKKAVLEAQAAKEAALREEAEREQASKKPELTDAERKALRDERYAARKARKKKRR